MTATIAAVAARLRSQLGVVERPVNLTPYGAWYGMDGAAWCDMFQSWAFAQEGAADLIGGKFAYTPSHAAWFQKRGQWQRTPVVGALNFMDWGDRIAHVGWVEAVNSDGSWVNIEGNTDAAGGRTGGKVMRQRRTVKSLGDQGGFGLVNYGAAVVPPRPSGIVIPACPGVTRYGTGLKPNAPSAVTRAYQQRLADRGWKAFRVPGSVDGRHGQGTSDVFEQFQEEKGLRPDGVGGEATWTALWS